MDRLLSHGERARDRRASVRRQSNSRTIFDVFKDDLALLGVDSKGKFTKSTHNGSVPKFNGDEATYEANFVRSSRVLRIFWYVSRYSQGRFGNCNNPGVITVITKMLLPFL